jgi:hypothetical protein
MFSMIASFSAVSSTVEQPRRSRSAKKTNGMSSSRRVGRAPANLLFISVFSHETNIEITVTKAESIVKRTEREQIAVGTFVLKETRQLFEYLHAIERVLLG